MDEKIADAIEKNETCRFLSLVEENEGRLQDTALHLASSYGHIEMVCEILRLCPQMVDALNNNHETPIHECCRNGNVKVLKLLLEANPKANFHQNCIHMAASRGHTDVVRELINKWPHLAEARDDDDDDGNSALHHACIQGHSEMVQMLLTHDINLAIQYNHNGYTPLHLAVMNCGSSVVSILSEFVSHFAVSFLYLTGQKDTVFHLAVRYGHYDALVFVENISVPKNLLHHTDPQGNSVLHLAVAGGHHKIAEFLITQTMVDTNIQNNEGMTALDMLDKSKDIDSAEKKHLEAKFLKAGAKRSTQLLTPPSSSYVEIELPNIEDSIVNSSLKSPPQVSRSPTSGSRLSSSEKSLFEREVSKVDELSQKILRKHKDVSKMQRENLNQLYYTGRNKKREMMQREGLLNARNTIILVAILIATVTFTAGITPPGGVYQDGPMKGKSIMAKSTVFKVFTVSNNIALFTSLSIVIVLVSVVPFTRKSQMKFLGVAHKVMWVAVAFMATGYVAAIWVTLPHSEGFQWLLVVQIAVGGGSLGTIILGLGVMLMKHRQRKLKWRKRRKESVEEKAVESEGESQNSDVESSHLQGYHSY